MPVRASPPRTSRVFKNHDVVPINGYLPRRFEHPSMTEDVEPKAESTHPGGRWPPWPACARRSGAAGIAEAGRAGALRAVGEACEADLAVLWWADPASGAPAPHATWRPSPRWTTGWCAWTPASTCASAQDVPGRVWESGRPERATQDSWWRRIRTGEQPDRRRAGGPRLYGQFAEDAMRLSRDWRAVRRPGAGLRGRSRRCAETSDRLRPAGRPDPGDRLHRAARTWPDDAVRESRRSSRARDRPGTVVGRPTVWERHVHPAGPRAGARGIRAGVASGRPFAVEYRMVGAEGRVVWFRDEAAVLPGEDDGPHLVHGVMLDITERKRAEEQVEFLAYHDKLTGLPNRAMFEELLELALARRAAQAAALSVLYLDLDDFKLVNDSLGHEAGDELLRQVADRLREATRDTDVVARQGGDEFLLLLADLDRSGLPTAGDAVEHAPVRGRVSLRSASARRSGRRSRWRAPRCSLSASIGISMYPEDATDARRCCAGADAAMYRSKRRGPGGAARLLGGGADAASGCRSARGCAGPSSSQHWVLHYQPIVDLDAATWSGWRR